MATQTKVSQQKIKGKTRGFSLAKACVLGANILLLIAFYAGFCSVRGKTINVLSFTDGILDVFELKEAMWYYYLANFAHSVLYLVTGVICTLRYKKVFVFWKKQENIRQSSALRENSNGILYSCILYFLCANMLVEAQLTQFAIIACIVAAVGLALGKVLLEIENTKEASKIHLITTGGYSLIEFTILFALALLLSHGVISGIIKGFDILFSYVDLSSQSGLYTVYKTLVIEVLYAVLTVSYLKSAKVELLGFASDKKESRKNFMKIAAVVLIIDVAVYTLLVARTSPEQIVDIMKGWFILAMAGFLPITLLSIAGNAVSTFPSFEKVAKRQPETQEIEAQPINAELAAAVETAPANTEATNNVEATPLNTEATNNVEVVPLNTEETSTE